MLLTIHVHVYQNLKKILILNFAVDYTHFFTLKLFKGLGMHLMYPFMKFEDFPQVVRLSPFLRMLKEKKAFMQFLKYISTFHQLGSIGSIVVSSEIGIFFPTLTQDNYLCIYRLLLAKHPVIIK